MKDAIIKDIADQNALSPNFLVKDLATKNKNMIFTKGIKSKIIHHSGLLEIFK